MIAQLRLTTGGQDVVVAPNTPLLMDGREVGKILEFNPATGHAIASINAGELELVKKLECGGRVDSVTMETKK